MKYERNHLSVAPPRCLQGCLEPKAVPVVYNANMIWEQGSCDQWESVFVIPQPQYSTQYSTAQHLPTPKLLSLAYQWHLH